jgi:signal transduction histidine kinase
MDFEPQFRAEYGARAVRVGIWATVLTLLVLAIFLVIPGSRIDHPAVFVAVLVLGGACCLVVARLPWKDLLATPTGVWLLYAWSAADIALITVAVATSRGGRSDLFWLYTLTTVFFAIAYPRRGQIALFAFTVLCYAAVAGWRIPASTLFLRLAMLAILAFLTIFLSDELIRLGENLKVERARSDRRATALATVASAGRRMTLDPNGVVEAALDAAVSLGFEAASLNALEEDVASMYVVGARGHPPSYERSGHPSAEGMTGRVLQAGTTVVIEDAGSLHEIAPALRGDGFRGAIATPVWVGGWMAAVLEAETKRFAPLSSDDVEAFELLAAQAGLALENAQRYEEELRSVERLEALDRLKTDFLTNVSHELRTPLTVIEGNAKTLRRLGDSLTTSVRDELLDRLIANSDSLIELVTNLLEFSRLQGEVPELQFDVLDLTELLGLSAERLRGRFDGRELVTEIDQGLHVHADGALLRRVVENLLSNAAKHTPDGTHVTLRAARRDGVIEVAVVDDGPGIPEDELPLLGEQFFRGGDPNTRPQGLGIGLALARELLRLHEADLEVVSVVDRGSRFSFRLPALSTADDGAGAVHVS